MGFLTKSPGRSADRPQPHIASTFAGWPMKCGWCGMTIEASHPESGKAIKPPLARHVAGQVAHEAGQGGFVQGRGERYPFRLIDVRSLTPGSSYCQEKPDMTPVA